MKHTIALCCLLLGLIACARNRGAVIDVRCDSAPAMQARLLLRLPHLQEIETAVEPDGLWRQLSWPADRVAVLGFGAEPGAWRFSPAALAGDAAEALAPRARQRLDRFLVHARDAEAARRADDPARGRALALHTTRALATELIGKTRLPVVFARFDIAGLDEDIYAADAIRDMVFLAGPAAPTVIWLGDGRRRVTLAAGARKPAVPAELLQAEIVALLDGNRI
jgi:hypothetical protein